MLEILYIQFRISPGNILHDVDSYIASNTDYANVGHLRSSQDSRPLLSRSHGDVDYLTVSWPRLYCISPTINT